MEENIGEKSGSARVFLSIGILPKVQTRINTPEHRLFYRYEFEVGVTRRPK